MIALDTNVLLRIFINDDEQQFQEVRSFLSANKSAPMLVLPHVLMEMVRVLRRKLKVSFASVLEILDRILEAPEFHIHDREIVERSLILYREGKAEFSDCLIYCSAEFLGAEAFYTFDRNAVAALPGAVQLGR